MIPVLFGCENTTEKATDIEAEKAKIQKVIDEHIEAIYPMDVNQLLAGTTDDFLEMPPNMPKIVGKEAYKEYCNTWKDFFETIKDQEMSFKKYESVVSGNWAFQIGTYSNKFILENDSVIEDEGNYVWIFKKESEGNWKWARSISNSTKSLPISE